MRILCMLLLTSGLGASGFAADASAPATPAAFPALHNQTVCPVMGKPIDSTVYSDIQGQRVYFCCGRCEKKMKADPDKYFKQAAAERVLFQNIQKTCPVTGETLEDKTVYSDYEGRRVYFCCAKCKAKFAADPQEYLKKLDAPAKDDKSAPEHPGEDKQGQEDHH